MQRNINKKNYANVDQLQKTHCKTFYNISLFRQSKLLKPHCIIFSIVSTIIMGMLAITLNVPAITMNILPGQTHKINI